MKFSLIILAVVVSAVFAQVPKPCRSPPQWESRYFSYDEDRGDMVRARISYDSVYRRERVIEEYRLGQEDDAYDILYLHEQRIEYVYDLNYKNCTSRPITRRWRDFGVPANATSRGEAYIGASAFPSASLLVNIWSDKFTDEQGNEVDYDGVWTYDQERTCLPVAITYYSQADNFNTHERFFDITLGISNPNVFVPRKECLQK